MARIRYHVLEKDHALAAGVTAGTETIELPETDILGQVDIQCRSLGAYTNDMVTPMHVIIKKIELLVNGSQVVKSLTGTQIRALDWYNNGPFAMNDDIQHAGNDNTVYRTFPLYLGRFAGDLKCGLDTGMYSNPQLKITWDTTIASWDGLTFDVHGTPTFTYSVICKMFDGRPDGFMDKYMQSSEIDTWNITASAMHQTEIPRGFDLWSLMWRGAYLNINPEYILENLKLDFDNGKYVPIDMDYGQLWQIFRNWYPKPCEVMRQTSLAHADTFDTRLLRVTHFDASSLGTSSGGLRLTTGRRNMTTISSVDWAGAANANALSAWLKTVGLGPHQTIMIPMKQLTDGVTEVMPTTEYKRIDLKTTTGASSAENGTEHLVAEYLKPNGV
jgi:hypothetical protein